MQKTYLLWHNFAAHVGVAAHIAARPIEVRDQTEFDGSPDVLRTIGIVVVSAFAESAPNEFPGAAMTLTLRRIKSATASDRRSRLYQANLITRLRKSRRGACLPRPSHIPRHPLATCPQLRNLGSCVPPLTI